MAHWLRNCSQSPQQENVYSPAPPYDARVSAKLVIMSELVGPTFAALELRLENPHDAKPMCVCVVGLVCREAKFSSVSLSLACCGQCRNPVWT